MRITDNPRGLRAAWSEAGFSLIELVLVLSIIALTTVIAVGFYTTAVPQARLREAVTELNGTFNVARIMAMSQNATITIKLNGATSAIAGLTVTLTGSFANPITMTTTRTIAGVETVVSTTPLTGEVTQLVITPGINTPVQPWVQFNSRGMRVGGGAATNQLMTLTNTQGRVYSVVVAPSGKARWCLTGNCP
jgi:prepilin-type N-terminal cleavage/methylation domain-containing protein